METTKTEKLAQIIKYAGENISKDTISKDFYVSRLLGFYETDECPDILSVTDDSGWRDIKIGDIRGNVSLNTGKLDNNMFHHGYALIYYENKKKRWKHKCFPPVEEIAENLEHLYNGDYVPKKIHYVIGDNDNIESLVKYLSQTIKKYVEKSNSDTRTAREIVPIK